MKLHFRLYTIFPEMNVWGLLVCSTVKILTLKHAYSHFNMIKFQA